MGVRQLSAQNVGERERNASTRRCVECSDTELARLPSRSGPIAASSSRPGVPCWLFLPSLAPVDLQLQWNPLVSRIKEGKTEQELATYGYGIRITGKSDARVMHKKLSYFAGQGRSNPPK